MIFRHLVFHIGRKPVGLTGMESNDHRCSPSVLVHTSLLSPQSHLRRSARSVNVVPIHLPHSFAVHLFAILCSLRIAFDLALILGCLYASCVV